MDPPLPHVDFDLEGVPTSSEFDARAMRWGATKSENDALRLRPCFQVEP